MDRKQRRSCSPTHEYGSVAGGGKTRLRCLDFAVWLRWALQPEYMRASDVRLCVICFPMPNTGKIHTTRQHGKIRALLFITKQNSCVAPQPHICIKRDTCNWKANKATQGFAAYTLLRVRWQTRSWKLK